MSGGVRVDAFLREHDRLVRGVSTANPEMALMLLIWQTPTDRALAGWAPANTLWSLRDLDDDVLLRYLVSGCGDPGGEDDA